VEVQDVEEKIGMELEVTVMVLAILRKQVTHLLLNSGQLLPKEMHLYIAMLAIMTLKMNYSNNT
jgi:hypothetical protein